MRVSKQPRVGEMVRVVRRHPRGLELLHGSREALTAATTSEDTSTAMLAQLLVVLHPSQLALLRFKVRLHRETRRPMPGSAPPG